MKHISIRNNNKTLVANVHHAESILHRFRGLIARKKIQRDEGMLLTPCSSVHTIGMTYPLDLVFIDKNGVVTKCVSKIKPFRFAMSKQAKHTLELSPGTIKELGIKVGNKLNWQ